MYNYSTKKMQNDATRLIQCINNSTWNSSTIQSQKRLHKSNLTLQIQPPPSNHFTRQMQIDSTKLIQYTNHIYYACHTNSSNLIQTDPTNLSQNDTTNLSQNFPTNAISWQYICLDNTNTRLFLETITQLHIRLKYAKIRLCVWLNYAKTLLLLDYHSTTQKTPQSKDSTINMTRQCKDSTIHEIWPRKDSAITRLSLDYT